MARPKIHLFFATYNRPEALRRRLRELCICSSPVDLSVHVVDDGSSCDNKQIFTSFRRKLNLSYDIHPRNLGKQRYWQTFNQMLIRCRTSKATYFCKIDDDFRMPSNFLIHCLEHWHSIQCKNKLGLHVLTIKNQAGLANTFATYANGTYRKAKWVDCHFFCPKSTLEKLRYRIFPISKNRWKGPKGSTLGSGVGPQISRRLRYYGFWYIPEYSLVDHEEAHTSVMNANIRSQLPIIAQHRKDHFE